MAVDFHRDMDNYLTGKRRKRLISDLKSKIMNKKSLITSKASTRFGEIKGRVKTKVETLKKKEPKKEITQKDIDKLVQKKQKPDEQRLEQLEEEGWEEVKLETAKVDFGILEEKKKKIKENLDALKSKEETEKQKITKFVAENEGRNVSDEDKAKQAALEEEINVLKDKQRIEEERLSELRKARRKEQMEALRGRVTDILFKKKVSHKKVIDEIKKEAKEQPIEQPAVKEPEVMQASPAEKEPKDVISRKQVREEVPEPEIPNTENVVNQLQFLEQEMVPNQETSAESVITRPQVLENKEVRPKIPEVQPQIPESREVAEPQVRQIEPQLKAAPEVEDKKPKEEPMKTPLKKVETEKPKRSFFSNFIEIKTGEQIAKEEEELLKFEEETALKDQVEINKMFSEEGVEVKTNIPDEGVDLANLFPENEEHETKEEVLELDQGYKIRVVRNE
jgi:hypothetical protein